MLFRSVLCLVAVYERNLTTDQLERRGRSTGEACCMCNRDEVNVYPFAPMLGSSRFMVLDVCEVWCH